MDGFKTFIPRKIKFALGQSKRALIYREYDSSDYWRKRARETGEAKVLWKNQDYNRCFRREQYKIITGFLPEIRDRFEVLDIGCGTGSVAKMLEQIHPRIFIDAVDFEEMIRVARIENASERIQYIASSAEDYFDAHKRYDLVISSACYSAIRDPGKLRKAVTNGAKMLKPGGRFLMIDPFHSWKYLARARYSSARVISLVRSLGFDLDLKSGVLFWPYREWLANSDYPGEVIERKFRQGERMLSRLGKHLWADYKILGFRRR